MNKPQRHRHAGPIATAASTALVLLCAMAAACTAERGHAPALNSRATPSITPLTPTLDDSKGPPSTGTLRDQSIAPPRLTPGSGDLVVGSAPCVVDDTRRVTPQIQKGPKNPLKTPVRNFLPDHPKKPGLPEGPPNDLRLDGGPDDGMLDNARTVAQRLFPSDVSSGWVPPDPTLAVGPNHVVVTANQVVAFYDKATGAEQFELALNNAGNPGFFETVGAGGFTFDPRCVYDHFAGRYIIMALETYNSNEAWIDIAVSDDSDPNGVWYKYRTEAVISVSGVTVWWDFPGLGFDENSIYITGNLFGLSASGGYGGGLRVFDKAPLLTGQPAVFSTLTATVYTTQPAVHLTPSTVGYLVHDQSTTQLKIYAVTGPATGATVSSVLVSIPARAAGPGTAPNRLSTTGTQELNTGGWTTPYIANGRMVIAYNGGITVNNIKRSAVYWYEVNLNGWPESGTTPTLIQSGVCDPGPGTYALYPAAVTNTAGDIGLVMGVTRADKYAGVAVAGRRAADPIGKMGVPVEVFTGTASASGRWGDYFAASVDPSDGLTFWGIGEYNTPTGWENWITSFRVTDASLSHPVPDEILTPVQAGVTGPQTVDVLANDWHSNNATLTIQSFDPTSTRGGTITRSIGTGPGGRDRLVYTPPAPGLNIEGRDSFNYTVTDGSGNTAATAVVATVYDPANYRVAENPPVFRAGVQGAWYDHPGGQTTFSDYTGVSAVGYALIPQINQPSTSGALFGSGRTDTAAVFDGFVEAPTQDLYTFYIESDDGSRLSIGGVTLIDNDGAHGMVERSGTIGLKPGRHAFRIQFFDSGGAGGLVFRWQNSTTAKQVVPAARLTSVRPCPSNLVAAPGTTARTARLTWTPPMGFDAPGLLLRRDGVAIATLPPAATTFEDAPPMPPQRRHVAFDYSIEATGAAAPVCAPAADRVWLSSGHVRFYEPFDGFADDAAMTAAGWQVVRAGNAVETADWTLNTTRAAPASADGRPSRGRFAISDSDAATGVNPTGGGASHDLVTPAIDCSGLASVFMHADISAQLNNNGTAVFDVDVSSDQSPAWTNVLRRVAPGRTLAPASSVSNADGVYGRLTVPLGAAAAGRTGVRIRLRHFEPTNDWFIGVDNLLVDDVDATAGGGFTLLPNEPFTTGLPAGWTVQSALAGTQTWTTGDPCLRSVPSVPGATPTRNGGQAVSRLGTKFAMVDSSCFATLSHDDRLLTPALDCTQAARVYLTFKSECIVNDAQTAEVLLSVDGGATFRPTAVFSYSRSALHDSAEDPSYGQHTLHVPEAAGQPSVRFACRFANSAAASWWAVDDVKVTYDPRCNADLGVQGGVYGTDGALNNNDFVAFIAMFFASDPRADLGSQGGLLGADGAFDNNDFIVFIDQFFAGC